MKIGIFGNTNNVPLALAIGLRQLGMETTLVVNRKELLHRPESRYPEWKVQYPPWIVDASDISEEDFITGAYHVADVINALTHRSDAVILNDVGPSLASEIQLPHACLLTGSDVTYYADYQSLSVVEREFSPAYRESVGYHYFMKLRRAFIKRQRQGIASARFVHVALPGTVPRIDQIMKQLHVLGHRRIGNYITHAPIEMCHGQQNNRLTILNGCRIQWYEKGSKAYDSLDNKGTNTLVKGFQEFIQRGHEGRLQLIAKGPDVDRLKMLIEDCHLEKYVEWYDELSMRDYYDLVSRADIVCDQFGTTTPGLVTMDAMAMGKPVVANFNLNVLKLHYPALNFACDADSSESVADWFTSLHDSPGLRESVGKMSKDFILDHCSPQAVAKKYIERFGW